MPRLRVHALIASFAIALSGCGSESEPAADSEAGTPTPTPTATATEATSEPAAGADAVTVSGVTIANAKNLDAEPTVTIQEGAERPGELVTRDLVKGDGPRITAGDEVSVRYTGVSWSTGEKFDASWDRGNEPITFPIGVGQVIPGWDEGVTGMRVGGRRLLIIPSELGYGAAGSPPAIGPDETLVFVVDAVDAG